MSYLEESVKEFKEKEFEIKIIEDRIREIERTMILPLKEEEKRIRAEKEVLGQEKFDIRLGDLMDELSLLTGIPKEEMYVYLDFNNIWTIEDYKPVDFYKREKNPYLNLTLASRPPHTFSIEDRQPNDFNYYFSFQSDFDEVQADGKTLLEHSYTKRGHCDRLPWLRIETSLYLKDSHKEDIVCHLKLWDLASSFEHNHHFPKDLFLRALQNHEEHKNDNSKENIKQLKK